MFAARAVPLSTPLPLLYSDESLIVVDKPSLLLSVPGRGSGKADSVVSRLEKDYPGIREVHRLDWETSGLMLLARNKQAHSELSRQFREREVGKRYVALVFGVPSVTEGEVAYPLRCDWPNRPRQMVDMEQGKPSTTYWRLLHVADGVSRVELIPFTGRSHQLRVHMQAIGHPILGDGLYAHEQARNLAPRLMLHARDLEITHPLSGERMVFASPVPF